MLRSADFTVNFTLGDDVPIPILPLAIEKNPVPTLNTLVVRANAFVVIVFYVIVFTY